MNEGGEVVGGAAEGVYVWRNGEPSFILPGTGVAINSFADIAGTFGGDAFLWRSGTRFDLAGPGLRSFAVDLNDAGWVVGFDELGGGVLRGFLWRSGERIDLGPAGEGFLRLNERGQVALRGEHALVWEDGILRDLGTLGGRSSDPTAINDRGWVVGTSETASGDFHAFLWREGTMIDLGTLGGRFSGAKDVNERGQVVGLSEDASGRPRAFLWANGVMVQLPVDLGPAFSLYEALLVNDRGVIAGRAAGGDGLSASLLFRPERCPQVDVDAGTPGNAGVAPDAGLACDEERNDNGPNRLD
ncbi:MAG: hypothetical protein HY698_05155 [Deltaproteobacteria bacterium]|nr:hypothetical protein [Deltaproteobacteria bacterium]